MDRGEYRRIEEGIDDKGKISEETARRLVAVAQGNETGEVGVEEALDLLVRAYLGRAVKIIDGIASRLPDGVELDEAKCLDRAVKEIRCAARRYDSARGPFDGWCANLVWGGVAEIAASRRKSAPPTVQLGPGGKVGRDPSDPIRGKIEIADPQAEEAVTRRACGSDLEEWRPDRARPLSNGDALMRRRRRRVRCEDGRRD